MSVVQRCPNCGTTRATPGECEACHEAQVGYFCTNDKLWLDASTCPKCGARFGEPARVPATPAPSGRARAPAPERPRASTAARPRPYPREAVERERWPAGEAEARDPGAARMALWQQLLQAALLARSMPSRAERYRKSPIGREAGGCLKRLLLTTLLLLIALGGAAFLFGRAVLGL